MTAADREAAARRQRAQTIALWRWAQCAFFGCP